MGNRIYGHLTSSNWHVIGRSDEFTSERTYERKTRKMLRRGLGREIYG